MTRARRSRSRVSVDGVVKTTAIDFFANLVWLFLFLLGPDPVAIEAPLTSLSCDKLNPTEVVGVNSRNITVAGRSVDPGQLSESLKLIPRHEGRILIVPSPETSAADTESVFRQFVTAGAKDISIVLGCSSLEQ